MVLGCWVELFWPGAWAGEWSRSAVVAVSYWIVVSLVLVWDASALALLWTVGTGPLLALVGVASWPGPASWSSLPPIVVSLLPLHSEPFCCPEQLPVRGQRTSMIWLSHVKTACLEVCHEGGKDAEKVINSHLGRVFPKKLDRLIVLLLHARI